MPVIDADTHVDETEDTWEYLQPDEQSLKPSTQIPTNPDPSRPPSRYWLIDGKRQLRFIRDDKSTGTTVQARELLDVQARLRQMDELEVDVHAGVLEVAELLGELGRQVDHLVDSADHDLHLGVGALRGRSDCRATAP